LHHRGVIINLFRTRDSGNKKELHRARNFEKVGDAMCNLRRTRSMSKQSQSNKAT